MNLVDRGLDYQDVLQVRPKLELCIPIVDFHILGVDFLDPAVDGNFAEPRFRSGKWICQNSDVTQTGFGATHVVVFDISRVEYLHEALGLAITFIMCKCPRVVFDF